LLKKVTIHNTAAVVLFTGMVVTVLYMAVWQLFRSFICSRIARVPKGVLVFSCILIKLTCMVRIRFN
jgi:hypothetical protein